MKTGGKRSGASLPFQFSAYSPQVNVVIRRSEMRYLLWRLKAIASTLARLWFGGALATKRIAAAATSDNHVRLHYDFDLPTDAEDKIASLRVAGDRH